MDEVVEVGVTRVQLEAYVTELMGKQRRKTHCKSMSAQAMLRHVL